MRILFTGSSSHTGYWFIKTLVQSGHEVVAIFQRPRDEYDGIRGLRVSELVTNWCQGYFSVSFGDQAFLRLIEEEGPFDLLCHHASHVKDYKSPSFDAINALYLNTYNIDVIFNKLVKYHCRHVIYTGSYFENEEGAGRPPLQAFSPYGLSKHLTHQSIQFYAQRYGMIEGKFVIPTPFGPYEDSKFTTYLIKQWSKGESAYIKTPNYIRDNIHVELLALTYKQFAENLVQHQQSDKISPSCYVESQADFAKRFAKAMAGRLPLTCQLELADEHPFYEPSIRFNHYTVSLNNEGYTESKLWDDLANYYKQYVCDYVHE